MGTSKRKSHKPPPQMRSRTTRSRGKALADPTENTQQLDQQLRALGLYAAPTLGDGNCLFRALSDQLYGTASYHSKLRKDICDWIESHRERYAPFVDDERGLDVHLQCMRQQATYGGHLELSAFAHMTKRNVKVVQPGLVYVIEWDAWGEGDRPASPSPAPSHATTALQDINGDDREKKLTRRERKRLEREKGSQPPPSTPADDEEGDIGPIYVAYHDWEHFSSIRNLRGPHAGLPCVRETPAPQDEEEATVVHKSTNKRPSSKSFSKPPAKGRTRAELRRSSAASKPPVTELPEPPVSTTPSQIPLPASRSPSPLPEVEDSISISPILMPIPLPYPLPPSSSLPPRSYRSPKRTFDESSASSESSQSVAKRVKGTAPIGIESKLSTSLVDADEFDADTPPLTMSIPGSPSSMSSLSELSSLSPEPTPPRELTPPSQATPLSKRERKKRGLPKPRPANVGTVRATSAGKIIIPGGKYKRPATSTTPAASVDRAGSTEEWVKNGTGRLDVRGFRELKI